MESPPRAISADEIAGKFVAQFEVGGLHNPRFLPQGAFSDFIPRVRATLSSHFQDSDMERLVQYSATNRRVFLICVLGEWGDKDSFKNLQWILSAVTFKRREFSFKIPKERPLPYVKFQNTSASGGNGHFGMVCRVGLLEEHLKTEFPRYLSWTIEGSRRVCVVAVKQLRIDTASDTEIENFFKKEKGTLEIMKSLHHKHLIEAIATYERGSEKPEKYFVFPWASGGSLRGVWLDEAHLEDRPRVALTPWALQQIKGLAGGLTELYKKGTRHGDIKPENILLFAGDGDSQATRSLGTLVIADVGIAKFHAQETRARQQIGYVTTNKTGTLRYEPPEIELQPDKNISRKFDTWSMGCVILEFVISLLDGSPGKSKFDEELRGTEPRVDRFWHVDQSRKPIIHPVVQRWITRLWNDNEGSALGDLLALVESKLLVGDVKSRIYPDEMHEEICKIAKKSSKDSSYLWNRTSTILTESRNTTTGLASDVFHLSQETLPKMYGTLPTRVIDVGDGDGKPMRLVETVEGSSGRYLALSHRWGVLSKEQRFCTYDENITDLKKAIPYDRLPQSFQDAVRVTRALHVQYLWIDSLCIIQDNPADWESEASRMEDVFSNAYCTIAASSAESSLAGFLGERHQRDVVSIQTASGLLHLAEPIDNFGSHVENSVLSSRGWVLQERALSRRTIYFTTTQVYWECGQGVFCETLARLLNPQSQFLGDSNFPSLGLQFYKDERIRLVQYLYRKYSDLNLSEKSDRSKAIIGLQTRIARQFDSGAQYGVLWKWLERTILWYAESPGPLDKIKYNSDSSVPSWSWMAYYVRIGFLEIPFHGVEWTGNIKTPTVSDSDHKRWDGRLQVEASDLVITRSELVKKALLDGQNHESAKTCWSCVVVGKGKAPTEGNEVEYYVLLIRPVESKESDGLYIRVGVASLLSRDVSAGTRSVFLI
ncbi:hypothetical protein Daus18300_002473 [Diaporthe australafricana]|uniref:Protein kinase domain-containing protein n=1 Tax=Diaporthe australafricana TaxID=127596 RepID=A0ABR3XNB6_9PEZI